MAFLKSKNYVNLPFYAIVMMMAIVIFPDVLRLRFAGSLTDCLIALNMCGIRILFLSNINFIGNNFVNCFNSPNRGITYYQQ